MARKINGILNIVMGSFFGVFLGYSIYEVWYYRTHAEFYAMRSAPWYTSILVHGMVTVAVLAAAFLIKLLLRRWDKKVSSTPF